MCLLIGVLAALLDWSGIGPHALRDRIAAIGYLASALGWSSNLGIAAWEIRLHHAASHDARVIWSMASVVPVGFWLGAMVPALPILGRFGQLGFRRSGDIRAARSATAGAGAGRSQDRINSWLLAWTIAVAAAVPLAMPSSYQGIVAAITTSVTGAAQAVGSAVGTFFGWS